MKNITIEKEISDYKEMIDEIAEDRWVDSDTTIVCCSPEYSSILCQMASHKLSFLNNNELFLQLSLEMPLSTMSQVWDGQNYQLFDRYLVRWMQENINGGKYLFLSQSIRSERSFSKLLSRLKPKLDEDEVRIGIVYLKNNSIIKPHYSVQETSEERLLFEWENINYAG